MSKPKSVDKIRGGSPYWGVSFFYVGVSINVN